MLSGMTLYLGVHEAVDDGHEYSLQTDTHRQWSISHFSHRGQYI